ncbi:MAG: hypothetical protein KF873_12090 [Gemmataceae bacterium]|nr:hypothetical protein [Gemmataceae bacterium]
MRPTPHPSVPHPDDLTLDERRRELAAILAAGLARLKARAALPSPSPTSLTTSAPQNLLDSETIYDSGLAVSAHPWLHGATG